MSKKKKKKNPLDLDLQFEIVETVDQIMAIPDHDEAMEVAVQKAWDVAQEQRARNARKDHDA